MRDQVEIAVIRGLGGALFESIVSDSGRILNPSFSEYRVPRMEMVLLDRKGLPSAAGGECPIVATAPAVGGALFQATGARRRSLSMA